MVRVDHIDDNPSVGHAAEAMRRGRTIPVLGQTRTPVYRMERVRQGGSGGRGELNGGCSINMGCQLERVTGLSHARPQGTQNEGHPGVWTGLGEVCLRNWRRRAGGEHGSYYDTHFIYLCAGVGESPGGRSAENQHHACPLPKSCRQANPRPHPAPPSPQLPEPTGHQQGRQERTRAALALRAQQGLGAGGHGRKGGKVKGPTSKGNSPVVKRDSDTTQRKKAANKGAVQGTGWKGQMGRGGSGPHLCSSLGGGVATEHRLCPLAPAAAPAVRSPHLGTKAAPHHGLHPQRVELQSVGIRSIKPTGGGTSLIEVWPLSACDSLYGNVWLRFPSSLVGDMLRVHACMCACMHACMHQDIG